MKEVKLWTTHEERYLKTHYPQRTQLQCAMALRRSIDSVRWKTRALGLRVRKKPWAPHELQYVEAHYATASFRELATALDRNYNSVRTCVLRLRTRHDRLEK